ncbi:hypothetical protein trd_A0419 (plasmid) [Thermomicrobium roseum DSM 5159]|uniref:Uncharacterized protein n=1 Tax=Thermomicrobium roseum (strain ATCC 27502 / DSM 5159 / P-2) TaxID=309801 RepID=B9L3Q5_THERP|nr:hypothetical protein trd_A0419 [Thermomicrobium roseum DSM 5159]
MARPRYPQLVQYSIRIRCSTVDPRLASVPTIRRRSLLGVTDRSRHP